MSDQEVATSVVPVAATAEGSSNPGAQSAASASAAGKKKAAVKAKAAPKKVAAKPAMSAPNTAKRIPNLVNTASTHPKYLEMVVEAIKSLNERSGSSKQALLKYISTTFKIDEKVCNQHLKIALKSGVKSGALKQVSGLGASGSFKLGESSKKSQPKSVESKAAPKKVVAKSKAAPKIIVKPKSKAVKPAAAAPVPVKKTAVAAVAAVSKKAKKPTPKPAKKAVPARKAATQKPKVVKKTLTKEAAKAKLPSSPTKGRRAPAVRKQPVVAKKSASKSKPINIVV